MKEDLPNIFKNCPVRRAMELLGGKWTLLIVHALGAERLRFAELRRRTYGISDKMLTQELKRLEAGGLVVRRDHGEVPPRVDYVLTALGSRALEVVDAIAQFGMAAQADADPQSADGDAERADSVDRNAESAERRRERSASPRQHAGAAL